MTTLKFAPSRAYRINVSMRVLGLVAIAIALLVTADGNRRESVGVVVFVLFLIGLQFVALWWLNVPSIRVDELPSCSVQVNNRFNRTSFADVELVEIRQVRRGMRRVLSVGVENGTAVVSDIRVYGYAFDSTHLEQFLEAWVGRGGSIQERLHPRGR